MVCKFELLENINYIKSCFILTMWYVNSGFNAICDLIGYGFYINYVVCKLSNISDITSICSTFYINYVVCKLSVFSVLLYCVCLFYINYVVCKSLIEEPKLSIKEMFYINYVVCKYVY